MSEFKKAIFVGACLALFPLQAAIAADAPQITEIDRLPAPLPVAAGGWYLRGDIGFSTMPDPDVTFGNGAVDYLNEKTDNTWLVGAGLGYRFNDWFRTDVTVDYRMAKDFSGNTVCGVCGGALSFEHADIQTTTFLWNAYVDLGTWSGFTPYVGGGVGVARHRVKNYFGINPAAAPTVLPNKTKWVFAGTVMGGASYDLGNNWALDGSYRYVWMGDAETGRDAGGLKTEFDDMAAHEVRIGLRYYFY